MDSMDVFTSAKSEMHPQDLYLEETLIHAELHLSFLQQVDLERVAAHKIL